MVVQFPRISTSSGECWFKATFENELEGGRDPSVWPKKLTFQLFQGWFELEWGSEVFDLGRGEIERERMDG